MIRPDKPQRGNKAIPETLAPIDSAASRRNTAPPVIEAALVEPLIPDNLVRNRPVPRQVVPALAPCPSCGTPRDRDTRFCVACSAPLETAEQNASVVRAQPLPEHHFRCDNCGSEVSTSQDQVSYRCPFCDSNYVVELPQKSLQDHLPEFIIGFAVTREKAAELFVQWMKQNSWFRPGDLRARAIMDKQRGVYLPFWHFSMGAESRWRANIGEYWYRTETYTVRNAKGETETRTRQVRETEWFPLQGEHHEFYYGYLVPAGRSLSDSEAREMQPFRLSSLTRYRPHFLAGWLCEDDNVPRDEARQLCEQEFLRREQNAIASFLPGDTYSDLDVQTRLTAHDSDLVLLPIHILTYRYKDKIYRFIVNGQTGKLIGQKPVSSKRIAALIGFILLIIIAIVLLILFLNR